MSQDIQALITPCATSLMVTIADGGTDLAREAVNGLDDLVKSVGFRHLGGAAVVHGGHRQPCLDGADRSRRSC